MVEVVDTGAFKRIRTFLGLNPCDQLVRKARKRIIPLSSFSDYEAIARVGRAFHVGSQDIPWKIGRKVYEGDQEDIYLRIKSRASSV